MQCSYVQLGRIAQISAGYPFRGAIRPIPDGDTVVVQIKNIDPERGIDWPSLVKTELRGRRQPDWLRDDDIIFSARGHRNVAVHVGRPPVKAVASPHFFLIRIKDAKEVLPEFVAWQMNLPRAQRYFAQSATGSFITSIRRDVLENMPLRLLTMERQQLLARLSQTARREKVLLEKLIENRQRELDLVARDLLL